MSKQMEADRVEHPCEQPSTDRDDGRLVGRKCKVCEWEGEVVERPSDVIDCPWCHGPTELINRLSSNTVHAGAQNPHASALGRLGSAKGGYARAAALTARQRREGALKAARARWRAGRPK